jgi:regulator of protease activity HflC (stomatin/prohibitin superfamily)
MFGFRYHKVPPTTHVIQYKGGKLTRQGNGLSFFYFGPTSTIVNIPIGSSGVPFVFEEVTSDFQEVTIQGEITFQISEPEKVASILDYSIDYRGRHRSDDPTKLKDRMIHATQLLARTYIQKNALRPLLISNEELLQTIRTGLETSTTASELGVRILDVTIQGVRPNPEMAKALQAEAREQLLQQADEAVHARRNHAVQLEREIKENELQTEIAIQEKQREVRETKVKADIAIELQRGELVDQQVANEAKESKARAEALKAILEPVKDIDWRTLLATQGGLDSKQMIAMAFRDIADNADKIGSLNISPDLLNTLLGQKETESTPGPVNQRRKK